jgi:hypothetical protein
MTSQQAVYGSKGLRTGGNSSKQQANKEKGTEHAGKIIQHGPAVVRHV